MNAKKEFLGEIYGKEVLCANIRVGDITANLISLSLDLKFFNSSLNFFKCFIL